MSEIPAYGTPTSPDNGFVTHRETAEHIWDTARAEARAEFDEERVSLRQREELWADLAEILMNPTTKNVKWMPADTEKMAEIKKQLGIE